MVATVSPADDQYHHTVNTLKYADRAKEIKTHIHKNIGTCDTHVADYQRMIENLQAEVCKLRKELDEKEPLQGYKHAEKAIDAELSCLNVLTCETSENVQERINLQKALFELEETNVRNRIELQRLDDAIAEHQTFEKYGTVAQALRSRRQVILDNIRDNDEAGAGYHKDIEVNEIRHRQLENMIEEAISNSGNKTYLHILSQYRLLGMANTELRFEIAMRDQFIHSQREAQQKMWNMLLGLGLDQKQIIGLAAKQAIVIEDSNVPHIYFPGKMPLPSPSPSGHQHASTPRAATPYDHQHYEDISSTNCFRSTSHSQATHHQEYNPYCSVSRDLSHSSLGTQGYSTSADTVLHTPEKLAQVACSHCPSIRFQQCSQKGFVSPSCSEGSRQPKESWLANRQGLQEDPRVAACNGVVRVEPTMYSGRSFQSPRGNAAAKNFSIDTPESHHYYSTPPSCPDLSKLPVGYASTLPKAYNVSRT